MTYVEFLDWIEFRNKRGPLNEGFRMEQLIGRLTYHVHAGAGGKSEMHEFIRFQDEQEASISDVASLMGVQKVMK